MPLSAKDNDLIKAAKDGSYSIGFLLGAGANVNAKDSDGRTALMWAIDNGHAHVAREILERDDVDVSAKDSNGETALIRGCRSCLSDDGRRTLETCHGEWDDWDANVLLLDSYERMSNVVLEILKHKNVDVNAKDNHGETALILAIGKADVALEILKRDNVDVDVKDSSGWTALMLACFNRDSDVGLEILKRDNVDVNAEDSEGRTALYWACMRSNAKVALEILKRDNVDVNSKDSLGKTALSWACINGLPDVALEILNRDNVDVDVKDSGGWTDLFFWACRQGLSDVALEILKRDNVDVNGKGTDGRTALCWACDECHPDVALEILKRDNVDVNAKDWYGETALYRTCRKGLSDVALAILKRDNVDVNVKNQQGSTALDVARSKGHDVIVRLLEDHAEHVQALEEMRRREELNAERLRALEEIRRREELNAEREQALEEMRRREELNAERVRALEERRRREELNAEREQALEERRRREELNAERVRALEEMRRREESLNIKPAEGGPGHRVPDDPPRPTCDDAKIVQYRSKLLHVMKTTSADPVELSLEYIERCRTSHKLGSGAFGDVFLAEDSHLPKKFAVKKIKLEQCDQDTIDQIRNSFQKELSTLKRFHHPNIIVLYGYNLNVNIAEQFLVYEYASNGSLDGFFKDDGNRARLTADIRLSIMFELARALHFLHTGGAGWKVFHRDIKSANICLAEDFTARLIDCGLAKFVPNDNNNSPTTTPSVLTSSGSAVFGTLGYMCPKYASGRCPFEAACDVYSIGIVMVELVLGCLIGGQSSRNGKVFSDVFEMYVEDEDGKLLVDGWRLLMDDADPNIIWNQDALELVCKSAIACMSRVPRTRLETQALLPRLSNAIHLNNNFQNHLPDKDFDGGVPCSLCNLNMTVTKCTKGTHFLCSICIEKKVSHYLCGWGNMLCPIDGCSSEPFQDAVLLNLLPAATYTQYIEKRAEQKIYEKYFGRIEHHMRATNESLQRLAKGLDRALGALSLLAANTFEECPNLVWVIPILVDSSRDPRNWIRNAALRKYKVVFVCAHSGQPGHDPFEITMPRGWIVKVAPWLKLCLLALKGIVNSYGLPFPIPNIPLLEQHEMLKTCLDSLIEEGTNAVLSQCEALLESGAMTIGSVGPMQAVAGDAFKLIAEKAKLQSQWKKSMVPVLDRNGTPMWVKGDYKKHYRVFGSR